MAIKMTEEQIMKLLVTMVSSLYLEKFGEEKTKELFKQYNIDVIEEQII